MLARSRTLLDTTTVSNRLMTAVVRWHTSMITRVLLAVITAAAWVSWLGGRRQRAGITRHRSIAYRDTGATEHVLDAWCPSDVQPGTRPVVLYIHGGGFQGLSKDTHWMLASQFVRRGYVVFNINYRTSPRARFPSALEDVCAAYRWVVEHAHRYGGDPTRIVVAGESAGANLAAALAVCASYRRPERFAQQVFDLDVRPAVVAPACGPFQITNIERLRPPGVLGRIRMAPTAGAALAYLPNDRAVEGLELADPVCVLEQARTPDRPLPPFALVVGTRDLLLGDTRRMEAALTVLGVTHQVRYYEGEGHAFHVMLWRAAARQYWAELFAFIELELTPSSSRPRMTI